VRLWEMISEKAKQFLERKGVSRMILREILGKI
jgi:hypothetical protein